MDPSGKCAIVTGAASGVGRATARALARQGASVVVADVDAAGGAETVRLVESDGGRALFVGADVSRPEQVPGIFAAAREGFGRVDIVHNAAGIVSGGTPGWPQTPLDRIERVIAVNQAGTIMVTRTALDHLPRGGVVVNTTGIAAMVPMPFEPVYNSTEAGLVQFTRACKPLWDTRGIRVNAILLPFVDTPMLAATGDGVRPADWVLAATGTMPPVSAETVAEAILGIIRDDSLVGEAIPLQPG